MKKTYKLPTVRLMGKLVYKTKGGTSTTNDANGSSAGSKPNPNANG